MRIEAGLVIGNRFRLLSLVGAGAFGSLWRAADRVPGKRVAIRIIGDPALGAAALDAFKREMISATAVRHRSLARIYAAGRELSGAVWVASELVDGESLESLLERQVPLPLADALAVIADLASALAEVHALGLAHGAVSPRVVLMPRSRSDAMRPMLIGLGRARLLGSKPAGPNALPEAAYFSPEAFASQQYGPASDVWSLGVLLFRCVSGRLPFAARTSAAMQVETRRLTRVLSAIEDPGIRLLIAECFALDPDRRPNASDLAARALVLARDVEDEEPTAIFSRPDRAAQSSPVPVEDSLPYAQPSLAPFEISSEHVLEEDLVLEEPAPPRAVIAPQPRAAAVPFNDVDEAVDFRPSRRRAKFLVGAVAAAAIFAESILASREPRQKPPAVAHVEFEPAPPVQPPAATLTPLAASTTEVPAAAPTASITAAASAAPTASAVVPPKRPIAKPRPVVSATATPPPAKNDGDENPYE